MRQRLVDTGFETRCSSPARSRSDLLRTLGTRSGWGDAKALIVVPGVTVPEEVEVVDHVPVGTVGAAVADGATHVVLGRSITRARDPRAAVRAAAYAIEAGQGASART